ncbi:hypothetical protein BHE74_00033736 [Ensete ventricosum]|nr:hypothetical protein GW17_00036497 [Ensete ventricosum]RWW59335.1 hypothetical protein BHE74_00033736 [Ensete ventricosum]
MKCSASSKNFHPQFDLFFDEDELRVMEEKNESDPIECEDATQIEGRSLCSRTRIRPDRVKGTDLYLSFADLGIGFFLSFRTPAITERCCAHILIPQGISNSETQKKSVSASVLGFTSINTTRSVLLVVIKHEDGETLMVLDMPSYREHSRKPADSVDDDGNVNGRSWQRGHWPTTVMDSANGGKGSKPRKRFIVKSANEGPPHCSGSLVAAFDDERLDKSGNVELSLKKKRKRTPSTKQGKVGSGKEWWLSSSSKGNRPFGSGSWNRAANPEIEFRDTIARGEFEV